MKHFLFIAALFCFVSCTNTNEKEKPTTSDRFELVPEPDKDLKEAYNKAQKDTVICNTSALDFLKLSDKEIQASFFHQLDSVRKVQYPKNDQDTSIYVELTSKLLQKFLKDINKEDFLKTNTFEKYYYFNTAPAQFKDSKECKDRISITFEKKECYFRLVIHNEFFAEWCQESAVIYMFRIKGNKVYDFSRNEAG